MASTIVLKKKSVAGAVPLTTDLEQGEVAINLADRKVYTKDNSNVIITLGGAYVANTPPPAPAKGDLWYDIVTDALNTYSGSAWQIVGSDTLASLTDVAIAGVATNNIIQYNGSQWVNRTLAQADIQPASTTVSVARGAVSVTDAGGDGSLAYNNSTGVITYTGPSPAEVRAHLSASGDLVYNPTTGTFSVVTYKTSNFNTDFAARTTDNLTEGSTNLYYTNARSRASVSATKVSGLGTLTYSSSTGVFSFTGPSTAEIRAQFTAGTGVTITNGAVAIGQAVAPTSNVTFNDVNVDGNLTVNGTVTAVNSTEVEIGDNIIVLNSLLTGAPTASAGFEVNRGTAPSVSFLWDETLDRWTTNNQPLVASTFIGRIDGGTY
jgi:hypothetical protein